MINYFANKIIVITIDDKYCYYNTYNNITKFMSTNT